MKISVLSARSGVSVPTIKYYVREGLLPPGQRNGPNQAEYGPHHEQRLGLIRGLVEAAGVSVAGVRRLAHVLDNEPDPGQAYRVAQEIVTTPIPPDSVSAESLSRVRHALGEAATSHGESSLPEQSAARALDVLSTVGITVSDAWLASFADAGRAVARIDLDELEARSDLAERARIAALGTALGDVVFTSFRRAFQAAEGRRRFNSESGTGTTPTGGPTESREVLEPDS